MEQYSRNKLSLFEFDNLKTKDENKYELIDGIVLMSPRPNIKHQEIMGNLFLLIGNFLKNKQCKIFTEIELEFNDNVIIPDISIICDIDNTNIQRYKAAPEIVIEILSPNCRYVDTFTKLYKYELLGVREYWIVNPNTQNIIIYNFESETNKEYTINDKLASAVFRDLDIKVSEIFET